MSGEGQLEAAAVERGPLCYKCAQGVVFLKKRPDPKSGPISKLARPVGSPVYSTGRLWTGPSGGQWAELNPARGGERGWMLVKGPGFGLAGPALLDAESQDLLHLKVYLLDEDERKAGIVWEGLVPRELSVKDVKRALGQATGLEEHLCCLGKNMPAMSSRGVRLGADYMPELADEKLLAECGFDSGPLAEATTLLLVYVGDYPKDLEVRPSLPPTPTASPSELKAGLVQG